MFRQALARSLAVACAALSVGAAAFAEDVKIVRLSKAAEQAVAAMVLTDVYKRAGIGMTLQSVPVARGNVMITSGEADGEAARAPTYVAKNPNLIKVETPIYGISTTAFAKADKGLSVTTKDDLKKYKVGIVRGSAHSEAATEGVPGVQYAADPVQLFDMLEAGRIEVAIDAGINGAYLIKTKDLKDLKAVGDVARVPFFHLLVPAKKDVATKIAGVLKTMKDSGELDKLTKKREDEFLASGTAP